MEELGTDLLYLNDTNRFECQAKVKAFGSNDKGTYLILDRTIFYPQGGGQPADQGTISTENEQIEIYDVRFQDGFVLHYYNGLQIGESVTCRINSERRLINAASHTAGHLIASIMEIIQPQVQAIKAYHFPEGPYVEFKGFRTIENDSDLLSSLNERLSQEIIRSASILVDHSKKDLASTIHGQKHFRTVQIGNFTPVPCGGTHLNDLNQLKRVIATKVKKTKDGFKISYQSELS